MGLFKKLFSNNKNSTLGTRFEMITDNGGGFYAWDGNLYRSDIIRSAIRPKSQAIGKLMAKHILNYADTFKINPDVNIKLLLEEPNPYMTGQIFQEKMTNQLMLNSNAFAYIQKDEKGTPIAIYPINAKAVENIEGKEGDLYLRFTFANGKRITIPYIDIIHIRRDFNEDELFGTSPIETLKGCMEVINTTDQGIVKAIKNSSVIKWILKFKSVLRPEDRDKEIESFIKNFLAVNKGEGVASSDPKYDLEQIKDYSFVPNAPQIDRAIQRLYSFFNTNEKIIQSKFNEDEWNSYYESEIEPVAKQFSDVYTIRFFSRKQRGFGNKIIFDANSLQYASMGTKLNLVQMVDRGALTPNEWREVMNLSPIENGDKPLRRLDTAVVEQKEGEKNE